ncbi:MAG TPA: DinB family protein [Anaerolineales bacterium]|nr:DinB family protein [Anaerolineales bacterium]
MDILDRLIAHDTWTTQQLLKACETLSDDLLDKEFDMDHRSLRETFLHMIENLETWTDLIHERPVQEKQGNSIPELRQRLVNASREFTNLARQIGRENRFDDSFWDVLDNPPRLKTFGGAIGHVLTHNMHHRAQIMYLMEKVGLQDHIEGDLLSWESVAFGWA